MPERGGRAGGGKQERAQRSARPKRGRRKKGRERGDPIASPPQQQFRKVVRQAKLTRGLPASVLRAPVQPPFSPSRCADEGLHYGTRGAKEGSLE